MSTLLSENWIEKVTLSTFASVPPMTTLKFGEKQMVYANISSIAIQFPKPYWQLSKNITNKEYGNVLFGVTERYDDDIQSDFSICVKKEIIDFFHTNYKKVNQSTFRQIIQEKFGLEMEVDSDHTIYFNLIGNNQDRIIDFGELVNMVFKQIGLVG